MYNYSNGLLRTESKREQRAPCGPGRNARSGHGPISCTLLAKLCNKRGQEQATHQNKTTLHMFSAPMEWESDLDCTRLCFHNLRPRPQD